MPQIEHILTYCHGLWLLIRGDEKGFALLDMTAPGVWRSFAAILWCLPASAVSWASWRMYYLDGMPSGTAAGPAFILKLMLVDLATWILPLVAIGILSVLLDFSGSFGAIVITTNWLSVPLSYAIAVPTALSLVAPGADGLASLVSLIILLVAFGMIFRLLRTVTGNHILLAVVLTALFIVPPIMIADGLRTVLGLVPD